MDRATFDKEYFLQPNVTSNPEKRRCCAGCNIPASAMNLLYKGEDGKKYCENCLPKHNYRAAQQELLNDERNRLDFLSRAWAVTAKDISAAEQKYCRLHHSRLYGRQLLSISSDKYSYIRPEFWRVACHTAIELIYVPYLTRKKFRYYRDVWQWNPEQSKIALDTNIPTQLYKWEHFYPLLNDPALHAAGVEIGARVDVSFISNSKFVHNIEDTISSVKERIVFRRDDKDLFHGLEKTVDCTHVAVNTFELTELPADQQEFAKTTENHAEIHLDPEEHFVALKSYVAGIAEIGLEAMFNLKYPDDSLSLPFGFNSLMQKQILKCLKELCPNAAKSILYKVLGQMLEDAPAEWIVQRWDLLSETYGINNAFSQPDFRHSLTPDLIAKLMDVDALRNNRITGGKNRAVSLGVATLGEHMNRIIARGTELPGVIEDGLGDINRPAWAGGREIPMQGERLMPFIQDEQTIPLQMGGIIQNPELVNITHPTEAQVQRIADEQIAHMTTDPRIAWRLQQGDENAFRDIARELARDYINEIANATHIPLALLTGNPNGRMQDSPDLEVTRRQIEEIVPEYRGDRETPMMYFIQWLNEDEARHALQYGNIRHFLRERYRRYLQNR